MYYLLIPLFLAWYFYPREIPPLAEPVYDFFYGLGTPKDQLCEKEENITKKQVEENTPDGIVVLKYEDDSFIYWADKQITYKYLETVARKYVILYDCKDLYINIFKELYNASKEQDEPVKESVFVKSKTVERKKGLVPEKSNKYKWKGKLEDLVPKEQPSFKPITFSDFKSMHST